MTVQVLLSPTVVPLFAAVTVVPSNVKPVPLIDSVGVNDPVDVAPDVNE